jgi:hypothetical protein
LHSAPQVHATRFLPYSSFRIVVFLGAVVPGALVGRVDLRVVPSEQGDVSVRRLPGRSNLNRVR